MPTVRITWTDSVTVGVTGHKLYRDDVEIADVGMAIQTFDDATAEPDTTYKYEIQAYTATHESVDEQIGVNVQNITTAVAVEAPTALAHAGGEADPSTEINLTWAKSITGVMTEYRVYIGGLIQQTFLGDVALGTLTGLTASTLYSNITVRAFDGADESVDSNSINVTTEASSQNPDVYHQTNAMSLADIDSTADITVANVVVTSDSVDFTDGLRSIKIVEAGSVNSQGYSENIPVENGSTYEIKFWAKVNVVSTQTVRIAASGNWSATVETPITTTDWTEYTMQGTTIGTLVILSMYARFNAGGIGDILWMDRLTIRKV